MNTGNDILFFMFIIIALFFIGTIVYLKRNITKLKKYLLFLSDKNKAFLFVILLFNVIWIPAVYVAHKYLGAFDTWQNSLLIIIVFIFVFSKGIEVLTSSNPSSYSIPYDGPSKSVFEKWLPFSKDN